MQRADASFPNAQELKDPSAGRNLVLCLLCDLKQVIEPFWNSVFPLQKAFNNPSHIAKGMNTELTAGSHDKSQYSKEMPQLIHPRGNCAAQASTYNTLRPHTRGRTFAIEGWQLLQSSHVHRQSAVEIVLINDRAVVQQVRHVDQQL